MLLKLTQFSHARSGAFNWHGREIYVNTDKITFLQKSEARVSDGESRHLPVLERPLEAFTLICFSGLEDDSVSVCESPEEILRIIDVNTPART